MESLTLPHFLTLTLFFTTLILIKASPNSLPLITPHSLNAGRYLPAADTIEYRPVNNTSGRRVLAPFQLCLDCRCCNTDDPSNCSSMPCCFGIDCDLPDKPYGVCAFVPNACNCTSCE